MKKIFFIFILIFSIFSFNPNYNIPLNVSPAYAQENIDEIVKQALSQETEDILDKPVFQEEQQSNKTKQITGKLSSIIIKIFGGILLLLVVVICLSFIWFANLQRKKDKRKRKNTANSNVIDAVENFAKLRIKE